MAFVRNSQATCQFCSQPDDSIQVVCELRCLLCSRCQCLPTIRKLVVDHTEFSVTVPQGLNTALLANSVLSEVHNASLTSSTNFNMPVTATKGRCPICHSNYSPSMLTLVQTFKEAMRQQAEEEQAGKSSANLELEEISPLIPSFLKRFRSTYEQPIEKTITNDNDSVESSTGNNKGNKSKSNTNNMTEIYEMYNSQNKASPAIVTEFILDCYCGQWFNIIRHGNDSMITVMMRQTNRKKFSQKTNDFRVKNVIDYLTLNNGSDSVESFLFCTLIGLVPKPSMRVSPAWSHITTSVFAIANCDRCLKNQVLFDTLGNPSMNEFRSKMMKSNGLNQQYKSISIKKCVKILKLLTAMRHPYWIMSPLTASCIEYSSKLPWSPDGVARLLNLLIFLALAQHRFSSTTGNVNASNSKVSLNDITTHNNTFINSNLLANNSVWSQSLDNNSNGGNGDATNIMITQQPQSPLSPQQSTKPQATPSKNSTAPNKLRKTSTGSNMNKSSNQSVVSRGGLSTSHSTTSVKSNISNKSNTNKGNKTSKSTSTMNDSRVNSAASMISNSNTNPRSNVNTANSLNNNNTSTTGNTNASNMDTSGATNQIPMNPKVEFLKTFDSIINKLWNSHTTAHRQWNVKNTDNLYDIVNFLATLDYSAAATGELYNQLDKGNTNNNISTSLDLGITTGSTVNNNNTSTGNVRSSSATNNTNSPTKKPTTATVVNTTVATTTNTHKVDILHYVPITFQDILNFNDNNSSNFSLTNLCVPVNEFAYLLIRCWEAEYFSIKQYLLRGSVSILRRPAICGFYDPTQASMTAEEKLGIVRLLHYYQDRDNNADHFNGVDWDEVEAKIKQNKYPFTVPMTLLKKSRNELNVLVAKATQHLIEQKIRDRQEDEVMREKLAKEEADRHMILPLNDGYGNNIDDLFSDCSSNSGDHSEEIHHKRPHHGDIDFEDLTNDNTANNSDDDDFYMKQDKSDQYNRYNVDDDEELTPLQKLLEKTKDTDNVPKRMLHKSASVVLLPSQLKNLDLFPDKSDKIGLRTHSSPNSKVVTLQDQVKNAFQARKRLLSEIHVDSSHTSVNLDEMKITMMTPLQKQEYMKLQEQKIFAKIKEMTTIGGLNKDQLSPEKGAALTRRPGILMKPTINTEIKDNEVAVITNGTSEESGIQTHKTEFKEHSLNMVDIIDNDGDHLHNSKLMSMNRPLSGGNQAASFHMHKAKSFAGGGIGGTPKSLTVHFKSGKELLPIEHKVQDMVDKSIDPTAPRRTDMQKNRVSHNIVLENIEHSPIDGINKALTTKLHIHVDPPEHTTADSSIAEEKRPGKHQHAVEETKTSSKDKSPSKRAREAIDPGSIVVKQIEDVNNRYSQSTEKFHKTRLSDARARILSRAQHDDPELSVLIDYINTNNKNGNSSMSDFISTVKVKDDSRNYTGSASMESLSAFITPLVNAINRGSGDFGSNDSRPVSRGSHISPLRRTRSSMKLGRQTSFMERINNATNSHRMILPYLEGKQLIDKEGKCTIDPANNHYGEALVYYFNLRHTNLSIQTFTYLQQTFMKSQQLHTLKVLDISNNSQFGLKSAQVLSQALQQCCRLAHLCASNINLGDLGLRYILKSIIDGKGSKFLVKLELAKNNITLATDAIEYIASFEYLKVLDLSHNAFTLDKTKQCQYFTTALSSLTRLQALSVAYNKIQDDGLKILVESIFKAPMRNLELLDIAGCFVSKQSMTIMILLLQSNPIQAGNSNTATSAASSNTNSVKSQPVQSQPVQSKPVNPHLSLFKHNNNHTPFGQGNKADDDTASVQSAHSKDLMQNSSISTTSGTYKQHRPTDIAIPRQNSSNSGSFNKNSNDGTPTRSTFEEVIHKYSNSPSNQAGSAPSLNQLKNMVQQQGSIQAHLLAEINPWLHVPTTLLPLARIIISDNVFTESTIQEILDFQKNTSVCHLVLDKDYEEKLLAVSAFDCYDLQEFGVSSLTCDIRIMK